MAGSQRLQLLVRPTVPQAGICNEIGKYVGVPQRVNLATMAPAADQIFDVAPILLVLPMFSMSLARYRPLVQKTAAGNPTRSTPPLFMEHSGL
jgi:hypothetical protein